MAARGVPDSSNSVSDTPYLPSRRDAVSQEDNWKRSSWSTCPQNPRKQWQDLSESRRRGPDGRSSQRSGASSTGYSTPSDSSSPSVSPPSSRRSSLSSTSSKNAFVPASLPRLIRPSPSEISASRGANLSAHALQHMCGSSNRSWRRRPLGMLRSGPASNADKKLYKTKCCQNWNGQGGITCPFVRWTGKEWVDNCQYAHGELDKELPHKYKTQLCDKYESGCPLGGKECYFIHPDVDGLLPTVESTGLTKPVTTAHSTPLTTPPKNFDFFSNLDEMETARDQTVPDVESVEEDVEESATDSGFNSASSTPSRRSSIILVVDEELNDIAGLESLHWNPYKCWYEGSSPFVVTHDLHRVEDLYCFGPSKDVLPTMPCSNCLICSLLEEDLAVRFSEFLEHD